MARFSQIRFKSFPATIAISPAETINYSCSAIFPRTAVKAKLNTVRARKFALDCSVCQLSGSDLSSIFGDEYRLTIAWTNNDQ
jgi:hypothetical protein